jgi:hypothetical protein
MPNYFFVTAAATQGRTTTSPPCATIDEALRGANLMLGNGAESVWIIDGGGNLVLPSEQVKSRLSPQELSATESAVG